MIKSLISKFFRKEKKRMETKDRNLGLSVDKIDERDYIAKSQEILFPSKYQIKNLPDVRHQLNTNSCASHALVAAYEIMLLNHKEKSFIEGSELYHYYNARKFINNTFSKDQGMTMRDACKTLHKYGMGLEYTWPFIVSKKNDEPSWITYIFANLYKVKSYTRYTDFEEIKRLIAQDIPVVCGIFLDEDYLKLSYRNDLWLCVKPMGGGHAQVIVGYNEEDQTFTLRNSWGSSWGKDGYCRITYQDLKNRGFDFWAIEI